MHPLDDDVITTRLGEIRDNLTFWVSVWEDYYLSRLLKVSLWYWGR